MSLKDPEAIRLSQAAYREQHREAIRLSKAAYREQHREAIRLYEAAYREQHREARRLYQVAYREQHREETRRKARAHYASDPEIYRARARAYGAKYPLQHRIANARWSAANKERIRERYAAKLMILGQEISFNSAPPEVRALAVALKQARKTLKERGIVPDNAMTNTMAKADKIVKEGTK